MWRLCVACRRNQAKRLILMALPRGGRASKNLDLISTTYAVLKANVTRFVMRLQRLHLADTVEKVGQDRDAGAFL